MSIKRVVIIGGESTGKSTLCASLAEVFQTSWVPEYARQYLEKNGPAYDFNDINLMARGHIDLEKKQRKLAIAFFL
jgi:Predicted ATPase/kinase involved in NAD metabolism